MNRRLSIHTGTTGLPVASRRSAYTLIELLVSSMAATVLMAGLASTLFIAGRALDGRSTAVERTRAAAAQSMMLKDLQLATSFSTPGADDVAFKVPDRDGDGQEETLRYFWTGEPGRELRLLANAGDPVTLIEGVESFQLAYQSRFIPGTAAAPPPLDRSRWGDRWATEAHFGYDIEFGTVYSADKTVIATRATLDEEGTIISISANIQVESGRFGNVTLAIYSTDSSLNPSRLLARTEPARVNTTGWVTLPTDPTPLPAGEYFLALCYDNAKLSNLYDTSGGLTRAFSHDAIANGWPDPWPSGASSYSVRTSIYATYTE